MKQRHTIPLKTLVEIKQAQIDEIANGQFEYSAGCRLYVVGHEWNADGTALYRLSYNKNILQEHSPHPAHFTVLYPGTSLIAVVEESRRRTATGVTPLVHYELLQNREAFDLPHACGVISGICGSLSLCGAWIPLYGLIGLPFTMIGIALGMVGLTVAAFHRSQAIKPVTIGLWISLSSAVAHYLTWSSHVKAMNALWTELPGG